MIYCEETGRILIGASELVSIARRHIAASMPRDEDEPGVTDIRESQRNKLLPEGDSEKLCLDFQICDKKFTVDSDIDRIKDTELYFLRSASRPQKPRREEKAQIRGEAFIGAYIYSIEKGLDRVKLNYTYYSESTGESATEKEEAALSKLSAFFEKCLASVALYATPEIERVTLRLPSMQKLKFPYDAPRRGQSEFIKHAYRVIARGGTLFATAPTGTGKTVSALYPAIRALGDGRREKVFYLTPKETTAIAACECLELFSSHGALLRAVMIGAKGKRCKNGLACRRGRDKCAFSGENNLAEAVLRLYSKNLTVARANDVAEVAEAFSVCPYELSLSYAELCDVIICDFNYLFDPAVYIRRFFERGGNYAFLIDEAHNLPDRAREMYSAELREDYLVSFINSELIGEHSEAKKAKREALRRDSKRKIKYHG